jgi:acetyl-CoA C-acetyltransferase
MTTAIVSGARTPFGRLGGALASLPAPPPGAVASRAALARGGVDGGQVDEVVMGMVLQAGAGQIPSRQATMAAGLGVGGDGELRVLHPDAGEDRRRRRL